MIQRNKKGQVPNVFLLLIGLGLGLIVFTIIISIGGDVLTSLRETSATSLNGTIGNETLTTVTETGEVTSVGSSAVYADCDIVDSTLLVTFDENLTVVESGNYTTSACTVFYSGGVDSSTQNNSDWNVSFDFTHNSQDVAYNTTTYGLTGVINIAEFNPTFGTIIVLAGILLLLGAVIGSIVLFRAGG